MPPSVVLFPTHGLANRLRAIASAHILAEYLGTEFYLRWVPDEGCKCAYEDLFDGPRFPADPADGNRAHARPVVFEPTVHTSTLLASHPEVLASAGTLVVQGGHEFKHPGMPEQEFVRRKRAFYEGLRPAAAVAATLAERAERTLPERTLPGAVAIAVHFRDYVPEFDAADGRQFRDMSPMGDFVALCKLLAALNPDARFLVFTNTERARRELAERVPSGVVVDGHCARQEKVGVRDALADLLLMSRCDLIVGSDMSSFSDEACFFAGTPKLCMGVRCEEGYHCHGTTRYMGQRFVMLNEERVRAIFGRDV